MSPTDPEDEKGEPERPAGPPPGEPRETPEPAPSVEHWMLPGREPDKPLQPPPGSTPGQQPGARPRLAPRMPPPTEEPKISLRGWATFFKVVGFLIGGFVVLVLIVFGLLIATCGLHR